MAGNSKIAVVTVLMTLLLSTDLYSDWAMYKSDHERSGVTRTRVTFPLKKIWIYEPRTSPGPAWPQPGKECHRLDFDYAFQPIAMDGKVFFGSSSDDTVRALSEANGELLWRFIAGGPIRFAPAGYNRKIFVACDDGWLYCLDAGNGKQIWKFRGAPKEDKILGNSRMISRWPLRSGVLIRKGVVYVTAGMWPSQGVCVYALDADTGRVIWCNDSTGNMYMKLPHTGASGFSGVAPQGYMLVSGNTLLVPTGRSIPSAFDIATGKFRYYRPGEFTQHGGTWATCTEDLFFNPAHSYESPDIDSVVGEAAPRPKDGMCIYSTRNGDKLLELTGLCVIHRVLVSGNTLYAADTRVLKAIDLKSLLRKKKDFHTCVRWSVPHHFVYEIIKAEDALITGGKHSVTAFDARNGTLIWRDEVGEQVRGIAVTEGKQVIVATDSGKIICYEHCKVKGLPVKRIRERVAWNVSLSGSPVQAIERILQKTEVTQGYALVVGERDSSLAAALCLQTDLHAISLVPEIAEATERAKLFPTGLYGSRISVYGIKGDYCHLPFAPYFADLVIVSDKVKRPPAQEVYRVLRPCGGVLFLNGFKQGEADQFIRSGNIPQKEVSVNKDMIVRGKLPGSGEWRHAWADGGHTGIGTESRIHMPLDILWFGGPGPDRVMSRHWGTSAPLSVNGRVFVTGQYHLICFDAYNGRELWTTKMDSVGRKFTPHFSANAVADDQSVYIAADNNCLRVDQRTGNIRSVYRIPESMLEASAVQPDTPTDEKKPYMDIEWPATWKVVGPFPKDKMPFAEEDLKKIPDILIVDGKRYRASVLKAVNGVLDFSNLYGGYGLPPLKANEKPGAFPRDNAVRGDEWGNRVAYAFAEIYCPDDGRLLIGAGADWWMQWFLDGKPVYNTLKYGNGPCPFSVTDHTFTVDVSRGRHVVAVMVKAGSVSWAITSTSFGRYVDNLPPAVPEEFIRMDWGYLSVTDSILLGSYTMPIINNMWWPSRSRSRGIFALEKDTGKFLWGYTAEHGIENKSIAFGRDVLFLVDGMSTNKIHEVKRRDPKADIRQVLIALNLKDGKALWKQDVSDVLPKFGSLQYSNGVVVFGAMAAYDAKTGGNLWKKRINSAKSLIYRNGLIAEPFAYDLHTGEQRMVKNLLSKEKQPWTFLRSYGCGFIVGCQNMLYFRSGSSGFFDFAAGGTSSFGGVRPNCLVSIIPANGLVIMPEGSSACVCGYNYQTSLALVPASGREDYWYVVPGQKVKHIKHIRLNLGAPGDRRDKKGNVWLGFPRPFQKGACPAPVKVSMDKPEWYFRSPDRVSVKGTGCNWIYTSGLKGTGKLVIGLTDVEPLSAKSETTVRIQDKQGKSSDKRNFTVCLHFAEISDIKPGQRVFDVKIQGRTILRGFDIVREGKNTAVTKVSTDINAADRVEIELVSSNRAQEFKPILSGIEIVEESVETGK